jgi:hypothetical protein
MDMTMKPDQFRSALKRNGFVRSHIANDEGLSECARVFGKSDRTVRSWTAEGPPAEIALILRLMQRFKLTPDEIRKLMEG